MKQIIPINLIGDQAKTIYAHYAQAGWHDFDPTSPIPHTAILEIEMNEPKVIQIANLVPEQEGRFSNPQRGRVYSPDGLSPCIDNMGGGNREPKIMQIGSYSPSSAYNAKVLDSDGICPTLLDHRGMEPAVVEPVSCAIRGRNPDNPSDRRIGINTEQRLEIGSGVANCLTSVQKDSMVVEPCVIGYTRDNKGNVQNYHEREIAGTLHTSSGQGDNTDQFVKEPHCRIRKLTPTECLRLMGVDDSDIEKMKSAKLTQTLKNGRVKERPMPKTQLYKMAGNSIVVDVLYHIFHQMFIAEPPKPKEKQLSLFDL